MNLKKFLVIKDDTVEVMAKVPVELRDAVNKQRNKMGITWNELMTAMFMAFIDEKEKQKK